MVVPIMLESPAAQRQKRHINDDKSYALAMRTCDRGHYFSVLEIMDEHYDALCPVCDSFSWVEKVFRADAEGNVLD